jgi:DNA phosphorothioation-dependent restriction protein DptH
VLPKNAASLLAQTFSEILGPPKNGTMAFTRALPPEVIKELAANDKFLVNGWEIAAIVPDRNEANRRCITADQAVELRENKGKPILLLIHPNFAGAGTDGIYSAAREISEKDLFEKAQKIAIEKLATGYKGFAKKALDKAKRFSRQRNLNPWQAFLYLCHALIDNKQIGGALPTIGLWPIFINAKPDENDLEKSAQLTERIFPRDSAARQSPEQRIIALKLDKQVQEELSIFLREVDYMSRLEALEKVDSRFWLNKINPGLFDEQNLQDIIWIPWRNSKGKKLPSAWSGLIENEDKQLELRLNSNEDPKARAGMEVRWEANPENLEKGSVQYLVQIRSGSDILSEKSVSHTGKSPQKVSFSQDDFNDIQENARFECQVLISAQGGEKKEAESDEFVLCYGENIEITKSSSGKEFSTISLAAAHVANDKDIFKKLAQEPYNKEFFSIDSKSYITCRYQGKTSKVFCPPLLSNLGKDWTDVQKGALGHWRLKVRPDGTHTGDYEFINYSSESTTDRFAKASRQFAKFLAQSQGPLGVIYDIDTGDVNEYILAAIEAWKSYETALTLIQTLEVVSPTGESIGLIVLPTHPLRVAWQQGFDSLVVHHRYQENLSADKLAKLFEKFTGANYPAFLPGLSENETFVFADNLGFHAIALVRDNDPEPKATISLLARLVKGDETIASTVGKGTSDSLAWEIERYLKLHPHYEKIQVHALRSGDAMSITRALGKTISNPSEDDHDSVKNRCYSYKLNLFSSSKEDSSYLSGSFLSATTERRRKGVGSVAEQDRWIFESIPGLNLPRLSWVKVKKDTLIPNTPAHFSIAFDVFNSKVDIFPREKLKNEEVIEAHGLMILPSRKFETTRDPRWLSYIPINQEGEKHPVNSILTKRLTVLHEYIMRTIAKSLGGSSENDWPVLITEVSKSQADLLKKLHDCSDWVITADPNAGIEYFDSPNELQEVYDFYIIDCVPQRDDLGFMQLITSTSSFDEIVDLLENTLGEMKLPVSRDNCNFMLNSLKSVSGRLALKLAGDGTALREIIALALVHRNCEKAKKNNKPWLSLSDGYFVPLDDIPELFSNSDSDEGNSIQRADLLYVTVEKKGSLQFSFVEIKFRAHLKSARSKDLLDLIEKQIDSSCKRWDELFGEKASSLEKTINLVSLSRILRFYAKKGRRHALIEEAYNNIMREIDRLVRKDAQPPSISNLRRIGYVFCPEYYSEKTVEIEHTCESECWLFGPHEFLPDLSLDSSQDNSSPEVNNIENLVILEDVEPKPLNDLVETNSTAQVILGHKESNNEPVLWIPKIDGNPHLMILGLPGMGKTTCLINTCQQLQNQNITPIVFSYHQDIDQKLTQVLKIHPNLVRYAGLGLNPMNVYGDSPQGYLDNIGMLRDIFAAIFPDLGDVQLGKIREALRTSYTDKGWGNEQKGEVPFFHTFLDLLRNDSKPDKGLLIRLNELDDYGLFAVKEDGLNSLLDMQLLTLIQIHETQNEYLQRAFATFILYNIYQNMFLRGPQKRITHAVIFDEAHRAAKLKLIPSMVKECRKYGIVFIVASQEAKDFDSSIFTAIGSYLALRLTEADARTIAKILAPSDKIPHYTDNIKQMPKFQAMYYAEGLKEPITTKLTAI